MKALNEIKLPRVANGSDNAARQAEQMNQLRLNQNFKELTNSVYALEESVGSLPDKVLSKVTTPKAYVKETGSDGLWSWRKWSDGQIEAWTTTLDAVKNCTTAVGGLFYAEADAALPDGLFTSVDASCITHESTEVSFSSVKSVSATSVSMYVFSPTSANISVKFGIHVFGK